MQGVQETQSDLSTSPPPPPTKLVMFKGLHQSYGFFPNAINDAFIYLAFVVHENVKKARKALNHFHVQNVS